MNKFFVSIVILLFGLYNLILYKNNQLGLYIHPRFFSTSLAASVLAIVVGVVGIAWVIRERKLIILQNQINFKKFAIWVLILVLGITVSYLFFILSILVIFWPIKPAEQNTGEATKINFGLIGLVVTLSFAFILPAKSLSSATASQRSIDFNSLNLSPDFNITSNFNSDTKNYSIGDWINSMNINPDYDFYNGKDVSVVGFIYTPTNYPNNYFLISRFAITCCAVDARPIGLKVRYNINSKFKQDDWVKVTGKFTIEINNNQKELVVIPEGIESTYQPNNPYIY